MDFATNYDNMFLSVKNAFRKVNYGWNLGTGITYDFGNFELGVTYRYMAQQNGLARKLSADELASRSYTHDFKTWNHNISLVLLLKM